uniref:Carbohydrate kinase FGGY N-terminal domain-containing protein n=1 Tax=Globisporangium ultimum (strain ATCC 200006 / CBS 805.95 / DAOM BR144) TaxID=431595 RepID=K3W9T1_GLOUD
MKLVVPLVAAALASAALAAAQYSRRKKQQEAAAYVALMRGLAQPRRYRDAPIVIVVDVGSSSIRASCFALVPQPSSASATTVNASRSNSGVEWVLINGSLQQLHSDCIDANGEADILQVAAKVETVVDGALQFLRATQLTNKIVGVGFSTFAMNILGIDDKGSPVSPVYTYAGRRPSTAAHARELRDVLIVRGALSEFHDRTGTVIHPAYAPAEFSRLHAEEPATVARVYKWQSISGYLIGRWTHAAQKNKGCVPMSFSEASWTGLFDFRHWQWDRALLDLVHMDVSKMPPLADSSTPFSGLKAEFSRRWPELQSVPFFLGIADGAAANIGSKCIDNSRIAVTIGTSAAIRIVLDSSAMQGTKVPKGLWCYRIGRDHVLLGGALNDGGSVYQFFRRILRLTDQDLNENLKKVRPNQHGLAILPFLSGERAPGWLENATCAITGINKWTTPVEVLHAALESVALRISLVFSLLAVYADPNAVIIASGTALTASNVWRQMLADSMGKDLVLEKDAVETTSRGIAIFVGSFLGLHSLQQGAMLPPKDQLLRSRPDVTAHAAYLETRHEQEFLYRKLYADQ